MCNKPHVPCRFQLVVTIGIFVAQLINFATMHIEPYGWRIR